MKYKIIAANHSLLETEEYNRQNAINWGLDGSDALGLESKTTSILRDTIGAMDSLKKENEPEVARRKALEKYPEIVTACSTSDTPRSLLGIVQSIAFAMVFKNVPVTRTFATQSVDFTKNLNSSESLRALRDLKPGTHFDVMPGVSIDVSEEGTIRVEQAEMEMPIHAEFYGLSPEAVGGFHRFSCALDTHHPLHALSVPVKFNSYVSDPISDMVATLNKERIICDSPEQYRRTFYESLDKYFEYKSRENNHKNIRSFFEKFGCDESTWYKAAQFRVFNGKLSVNLPQDSYFDTATNCTRPLPSPSGNNIHIFGNSVGGEIGVAQAAKGRFASKGGSIWFYDKKPQNLTNANRMTTESTSIGTEKALIRMCQVNNALPYQAMGADTEGFTFGKYLEHVLVPLFRGGARQFVFNEMDDSAARSVLQLATGAATQAYYLVTGKSLPLYEIGVADNTGPSPSVFPMTYIMFPEDYVMAMEQSIDKSIDKSIEQSMDQRAEISPDRARLYNPSLLSLVKATGWTNVADGNFDKVQLLLDSVGGIDNLSPELKTSVRNKDPLCQPPETVMNAGGRSIAFMRILIEHLNRIRDEKDPYKKAALRLKLSSSYTFDGPLGELKTLGLLKATLSRTYLVSEAKDPANTLSFFSGEKRDSLLSISSCGITKID